MLASKWFILQALALPSQSLAILGPRNNFKFSYGFHLLQVKNEIDLGFVDGETIRKLNLTPVQASIPEYNYHMACSE
jgi:hypothetical protein